MHVIDLKTPNCFIANYLWVLGLCVLENLYWNFIFPVDLCT